MQRASSRFPHGKLVGYLVINLAIAPDLMRGTRLASRQAKSRGMRLG